MKFIQNLNVIGPNIMLILFVLFVDIVSVHCHIYDEASSVSLINRIDRYHRSTGDEFDDHGHTGHDDEDLIGTSRYTNEWVVKITGGAKSAAKLAEEMGFEIHGMVQSFPDLYRLHKSDHPRRGRAQSSHVSRQLADDVRVMWAEQQYAKRRQKRGYIPDDRLFETAEESVTNEEDRPLVRVKRESDENADEPHIRQKRSDMEAPSKSSHRFNDELWDHQWYMHDTRTNAALPRLDLNILPVYDMGYTGRGVTVVVLDDGLEGTHTDIRNNYNSKVSFDMNDDDPDPSPRYGRGYFNSHGTRCAGEIAMEANNAKCGVGVAFNVSIGGVRMLDGPVSDRVEASSLIYALEMVDIYSASWGPSDDGKTVEGPGKLVRQAFYRGVKEGRKGKGAIYIWASGNGGRVKDNCNCDGYVSSIYTLSIGSVSEQGDFPWYGEQCASTMAVTYSSGAYTDQKIATVDLNDTCTMDHTGTSAAAPLASGIVALALEANSNLTWRDVQHLVPWTSEYGPLKDNIDWQENSAGFRVNPRFGFGLMNAAKYVRAAINWSTVPEKSICVTPSFNGNLPVLFTNKEWGTVEFESDGCSGTLDEVNYLEHVEVIVSIEYPVRGQLEIDLISPSGTSTQLVKQRPKDKSKQGYVNWPFMSVHTWGEMSKGRWKLIVTDLSSQNSSLLSGRIVNATLVLHGTSAMPEYRKNGARIYDDAFNRLSSRSHEKATMSGSNQLDDSDEAVDINQLRSENPNFSWKDLIGLKLTRHSYSDEEN
ncbi:neuroendocrine convertase 1-like [Daphnia pulicaria]|uniref:neuroendocrine convertase 1-like n=1 Tax=Daphnia pulicaria TaxID=35523 RepID=UPI001EE9FE7B|nr:neuroendocrine convertase 1-like [Daphnia pulicaria]XP_046655686.1 neuroendocrine convertase 1-like [Daphnia pulicaria]